MNKQLEIIGLSPSNEKSNATNNNNNAGCDFDQSTASLLKSGLRSGSQKAYKEALLLEQYRNALLEQANELRSEIQRDIVQKSKKLAPSIFGWNNTQIPGLNPILSRKLVEVNGDYERIWETLIGLEAHDLRLEDPRISAEFFAELQNHFLSNDLRHVDPKFLMKYPWLKASVPGNVREQSFAVATKKKRNFSVPARLFLSKKSSSQQRLEKELADQEAELKKKLNVTFKANPIPESSVTPKYEKIMENQGTKSARIRESVLRAKLEEKTRSEAIEKELILKKQISQPSNNRAHPRPVTCRKINPEEKREAVLREIMKECTFKPIVSKKIPNFGREHQKFKEMLENSKSRSSTTIPQPFQLSSTTPMRRPKTTASIETATSPTSTKKFVHTPVVITKSTKTAELKVRHLQEEKEAQKLIEQAQKELLEAAESKRMAIAERLRVRLESSSKSAKERQIKQKVKSKLQYQEQTERDYLERIEEMQERLDSRKCLFERVEIEAARNRANQQIRDILVNAGKVVGDFE